MRHQRRKSRDDRDRDLLEQPALHRHPLLDKLVAVHIRLVEDQILRRIEIRLPAVQAAVLQKLPRLDIAVGHDQLHVIILIRAKHHVEFLGIHTAAYAHLSALFIQCFYSLFVLAELPDRCQYCVHD